MSGGRPSRLLEDAGLQVKRSANGWLVKTRESYLHTRPDLVTAEGLVAPGQDPPEALTIPIGPTGIGVGGEDFARLAPQPPAKMELLDLFNYGHLAVTFAESSAVVEEASGLLNLPLS